MVAELNGAGLERGPQLTMTLEVPAGVEEEFTGLVGDLVALGHTNFAIDEDVLRQSMVNQDGQGANTRTISFTGDRAWGVVSTALSRLVSAQAAFVRGEYKPPQEYMSDTPLTLDDALRIERERVIVMNANYRRFVERYTRSQSRGYS